MTAEELRKRAAEHYNKSDHYHRLSQESWGNSLRSLRNAGLVMLGGTLVTASAVGAETYLMNGFNVMEVITGLSGLSLSAAGSIHFGLHPSLNHAASAIESRGSSRFHKGAGHAHSHAATLIDSAKTR